MQPWKHESRVDGWFSMVEIEINSLCNRHCPYCPNSTLPHDPDIPEIMPDHVLARLLSELKRIKYAGRISFHFYGEPLLHPNLLEVVRTVAAELPAVRLVLYTNGDLLSDRMYNELHRSGISRFIVTSHDSRHVSERPDQVVLFPADLILTNRGGSVQVGMPTKPGHPLSAPCFAPSSLLIVTITGDIVLCYEDARRSTQMGNILDCSIEDIWFGDRFRDTRRRLACGDRTVTTICAQCNNASHPNPDTYDYRP